MRRLSLLIVLSACTRLTDPQLPDGAEPFVPPAIYQTWWNLTQVCSGLSGSMGAVSWYRVPDVGGIPLDDGTAVQGRWDAVGNRIVLAGDVQLAGDLVRHEMLHALLRSPGHPRSAFITGCSGVVVCTKTCISDAAPSPPPNSLASSVSPAALVVGVEVTPARPGAFVNGGHFMLVVSARNPTGNPVIVRLPSAENAGPSASFSVGIIGNGRESIYDMRAEVPEDTWFTAGEVKRFLFDVHVGPGTSRYEVAPGTYRFEGSYGGVSAPNPPTVTVSP